MPICGMKAEHHATPLPGTCQRRPLPWTSVPEQPAPAPQVAVHPLPAVLLPQRWKQLLRRGPCLPPFLGRREVATSETHNGVGIYTGAYPAGSPMPSGRRPAGSQRHSHLSKCHRGVPWLDLTQWPRYVQGHDFTVVARLASLPEPTTEPLLATYVDSLHLLVVRACRSVRDQCLRSDRINSILVRASTDCYIVR